MFRRSSFLYNTEGTAAPSGAQPAAAPAVVATPAAPAVPAATPGAASAAGTDGTVDPAWLGPRLARERESSRKAALAELGITDPAAAKQVLADANAAAEAKKSAEQKLLETGGRVTTLEQENIRLKEATATYAAAQMASLSAEQQAAVRALAADTDPAGQLKTITALAPTWGKIAATPPAVAPAAGAPPAPAPGSATPPASTAPAVGSPPPAAGSPPDHKAEYTRLKVANPIAAAAYMNQHADKIYPRA